MFKKLLTALLLALLLVGASRLPDVATVLHEVPGSVRWTSTN